MGRRVLLSAFLDTNVVVRFLVGDPPDQAERATRLLESAEGLLLVDLVIAECVYVLQSVYGVEPARVAELLGRVISFASVRVVDAALLTRALDVYASAGVGFADAYLVASAELSDVGMVMSFTAGSTGSPRSAASSPSRPDRTRFRRSAPYALTLRSPARSVGGAPSRSPAAPPPSGTSSTGIRACSHLSHP